MTDNGSNDVMTLTTEIVASLVGNGAHIKAEEIPALIRSVRAALSEDAAPTAPTEPETQKATKGQINKSIKPHGLTSFVDGKIYKTLKRHLTRHGHTMASYREAYGLPVDYPSVASEYSATRSAMAKKLGLGAQGRGSKPSAPEKPAAKTRKKAEPATLG